MDNWPTITRFAPSPNGLLHLGHALSAIHCHDLARRTGGAFLLRIEDIDAARSRPEFVAAILADLRWLGLAWDGPVLYQSHRIAAYRAAFERLRAAGLAFRCFCTRADIVAEVKAHPVRPGPDGPVYPGTCRALPRDAADRRAKTEPFAWRLKMDDALVAAGGPLHWNDLEKGRIDAASARFGDIVLWRKDEPASYHLAASVDDAFQRIDPVVRGMDLFAYTDVHRLLQALLGLPVPAYWHHPLLLDADGEKLAKSRGSAALAARRAAGEDGPALAEKLRSGEIPAGISLSAP